MENYENLSMSDKIDFLTSVMRFKEENVNTFITNIYKFFNNYDNKAKLKCEKYPSVTELLEMAFDTLIADETPYSSLKEAYNAIKDIEIRIKNYSKKLRNTWQDF